MCFAHLVGLCFPVKPTTNRSKCVFVSFKMAQVPVPPQLPAPPAPPAPPVQVQQVQQPQMAQQNQPQAANLEVTIRCLLGLFVYMLFSFSPCGQLLVFLGHCRVRCSEKFIIILAFKAGTYIEFAFRCQLAVLGYYRTRCSVKFILFWAFLARQAY